MLDRVAPPRLLLFRLRAADELWMKIARRGVGRSSGHIVLRATAGAPEAFVVRFDDESCGSLVQGRSSLTVSAAAHDRRRPLVAG